jgi:hypothetical protein
MSDVDANLAPLNRASYSGVDFASFYDLVLRYVREYLDDDDAYNDFLSSAVNGLNVRLAAFVGNELSWYLDRRMSESFLASARERASVWMHAEQRGYSPRTATPASGSAIITFDSPPAADSFVPGGFRVLTPSGVGYEVVSDTAFSAGAESVTVSVTQGVTRTQTFVSSGLSQQQFNLSAVQSGEYITEGATTVLVNGVEWEEVRLFPFEASDVYQIGYGESPPVLRFGSGISGNIPTAGATIQVTMRCHVAESGGARAGELSVAPSGVPVAGSSVGVSVTNPSAIPAGTAIESIESIRTQAPLYEGARGTAVSVLDYIALATAFTDPAFGSVERATAINTRNIRNDVETLRLEGLVEDVVTSGASGLTDASSNLSVIASSLATRQADAAEVSEDLDVIEGTLTSESSRASVVAASLATNSATIEGVREQIQSLLKDAEESLASTTVVAGDVGSTLDVVAADANTLIIRAKAALSQIQTAAASLAALVSGEEAAAVALGDAASSVSSNASAAESVEVAIGQVSELASAASLSAAEASSTMLAGYESASGDLLAHVGSLHDEDCKANLITVPVLSRDSNGLFVRPSVGLMRSLQRDLRSRSGVSHQVFVVDGSDALVPINVTIYFVSEEGSVSAENKSRLESLSLDIIRSISFGERLDVSDVTDRVRDEERAGTLRLERFNVELTCGVDGYIDDRGNAVVDAGEIVTAGTIQAIEEDS